MKWSRRPFFFMKPSDAVVPVGQRDRPDRRAGGSEARLEYEVELVACLRRAAGTSRKKRLKPAFGAGASGSTSPPRPSARDERDHALGGREGHRPERPVPPAPGRGTPMPAPADIYLYKNNEKVQSGRTDQMMVSPAGLIVEPSRTWGFSRRHRLHWGRPRAWARVKKGDVLLAGVNGVGRSRRDRLIGARRRPHIQWEPSRCAPARGLEDCSKKGRSPCRGAAFLTDGGVSSVRC